MCGVQFALVITVVQYFPPTRAHPIKAGAIETSVENLMFIGPCIIAIVGMKEQLDVTCYFISLIMRSTCFGH